MSKLSIFDSAWTDMVFEGRNKDYGAYQLRRENPRTTIIALFTALALLGVALMIPNIVKYFSPPAIASLPDEIIVLNDATNVDLLIEPTKPKPTPPTKAAAPLAPEVPDTFREMQVTEKPTGPAPVNNTEAIPEGNPNGLPNGIGLPTTSGGGTTGDTEAPTEKAPAYEGPMGVASADVKPEFPGGMDKFYKYVSRNFKVPQDDNVAGNTLKVIVYFVIERDGSMTDIKVLRNPGYGMDKEAIRVLKSMNIKWKPGRYKGQEVRIAYTLPITLQAPE